MLKFLTMMPKNQNGSGRYRLPHYPSGLVCVLIAKPIVSLLRKQESEINPLNLTYQGHKRMLTTVVSANRTVIRR